VESPPAEVLTAFGITETPVPLTGGQGQTWRAGDLVLKPEDADARVAWLVDTIEQLPDTDDFRLARHVRAGDGRLLVDGWEATGWLAGAHLSESWADVLTVSRAFHAALATVPVPSAGVPGDDNHWRIADRVAWGEQPCAADVPAAVRALFDRLQSHVDAPWTGSAPQLIHADIGNNVLFAPDEGLPPAIIDVSPYVRPAEFANAMAVADAMAWQGAPLTHAIRFVTTVDGGDQLLARAVVFRIVAAALVWPGYPERLAAEVDAYRPVLSAL